MKKLLLIFVLLLGFSASAFAGMHSSNGNCALVRTDVPHCPAADISFLPVPAGGDGIYIYNCEDNVACSVQWSCKYCSTWTYTVVVFTSTCSSTADAELLAGLKTTIASITPTGPLPTASIVSSSLCYNGCAYNFKGSHVPQLAGVFQEQTAVYEIGCVFQ